MVGFRTFIHVIIFLLVLMFASPTGYVMAQGFHSGGVGTCSGCHSMHSSQSGSQWLLQKSDSSSICLNCHSGSGGPNSPSVFSANGSALTPGGDFYWLTKSFSWLDGQSPGHDHGHNIVAFDFNLFADPVLTTAPGGAYPAANLGCVSCHDPHGQVRGGTGQGRLPVSKTGSYGAGDGVGAIKGNYRLLGDAAYVTGGYSFSYASPVARQSNVNKFEESDSSHVDYGTGMSEWCGNCHEEIVDSEHHTGAITFRHPTDSNEQLDGEHVDMYNRYVRTGDLSGVSAAAYLQFVPFERGTSSLQLLDPNSTYGPNANSNVMCLTCHRAHASSFSNSGRWDFTASLLVNSHPAIGDVGATANDVYYSYYGRDIVFEFGSSQGQFCEKCHGATLP